MNSPGTAGLSAASITTVALRPCCCGGTGCAATPPAVSPPLVGEVPSPLSTTPRPRLELETTRNCTDLGAGSPTPDERAGRDLNDADRRACAPFGCVVAESAGWAGKGGAGGAGCFFGWRRLTCKCFEVGEDRKRDVCPYGLRGADLRSSKWAGDEAVASINSETVQAQRTGHIGSMDAVTSVRRGGARGGGGAP